MAIVLGKARRGALLSGFAAALAATMAWADVQREVVLPEGVAVRITVMGDGAALSVEPKPDAAIVSVSGDGVTNALCEVVGELPEAMVFGNGWYVKRPGDFSVGPNGHANATSFDGFELASGASLVMASDRPIVELFVKKSARRFGVRIEDPDTFTLVTGRRGAFEAAMRYRDKYDRRVASPGVKVKAGKFCIDAWNGLYGQHADFIEEAATKYGLRGDLFFYSHNWQREGYDYKLPDVWPPNPRYGTKADMYRCRETALKYGWGFGLHLNTSDFYEDSSDFSFDKVSYTKEGKPEKAWYNAFMKAQSYRMLYDYAPVSMAKVLAEMNGDGFPVDTMFVDVIGSHPARPYWKKDGSYHRRSEAVAFWGKVFDVIRDTQTKKIGRQAFTSSEAVGDFLMGHLDGGDCQWMVLGREPGEYRWMRIREAGRIVKAPWFDAVNHSRISLHGVGYSIRFEGGRGEDCHGIDSDDYLSLEMLSGHALMTDAYSRDVRDVSAQIVRDFDKERVLRQVSRVYYLAQHIVREIALDDMESFEFVGGDLGRQKVVWKGGMRVWVNRGEGDWTVEDGVVLPQYGFYAKSAKTGSWAKIAKFRTVKGDEVVAEASEWHDGTNVVRYANGRGEGTPGLLPYTPSASVRTLAGGKIEVDLSFEPYAKGLSGAPPPDARYDVSLWLVQRKTTENNNTLPDHRIARRTVSLAEPSTWAVSLPSVAKRRYDLMVSVVPAGRPVEHPFEASGRMKLLGTPSFFRRYHLGSYDTAKGVFVPFVQPDRALWSRLFAPKDPVDFGWTKIKGRERREFLR